MTYVIKMHIYLFVYNYLYTMQHIYIFNYICNAFLQFVPHPGYVILKFIESAKEILHV